MRHLSGGMVDVESAGIEAHGKNRFAIHVMAEAGVDISGQASTKLSSDMLAGVDTVVTVCGHADAHCPVLDDTVQKLHWPLEDPANAQGPDDVVLDVYRASRDEIRERVCRLLADWPH